MILGIWQRSSITTAEDFLRNPRIRGLTFSLVATNITVAGIFFGLIDGAKVYGWSISLAPLTTAIGLIIFIYFGARGTNIPQTVGESLGKNPPLSLVISFSMILVFALGAGFEIYVTSQLLFGLGGFALHNLAGEVAITMGLALVFMAYTLLGGFRSVVRTDCIQFGLFLMLVIALLFHRWPDVREYFAGIGGSFHFPSATISNFEIVAFTVSLLVLNVAAQFMNPGNWLILTNAGTQSRARRIFYGTITILSVVWFVVLVLAFALPANTMTNQLFAGLSPWIGMTAVAGLVAATLSTVDSLMLGSLKLVRDVHDARRPSSPMTLRQLRLLVPFIYLPVLLLMLVLLHRRPDLFSAMLAISNGMAVFVPVFAACFFVGNSVSFSPRQQFHLACWIGTLFGLTAACSITLIGIGKPTHVVYVGPLAFAVSCAIVLFFVRRASLSPDA